MDAQHGQMMKAIFHAGAAFTLVCVLALTGCVTSPRALSAHDQAQPDTRLLGDWEMTDSSGNKSLLHITVQGDWMQLDARPFGKTGAQPELPSDYLGFPSHLAGHDFMNVLATPEESDSYQAGYVFYLYSIEGKRLQFVAASSDELKRQAQLGRIHISPVSGKDGKPSGNYVLEESTESLDKFIASADLKKLFSGEKMEAVRVGSQ